MYCENNFCIYEDNGSCILNEIRIDGAGNCTECIYFNIDSDLLNELKTKTLKKLENR